MLQNSKNLEDSINADRHGKCDNTSFEMSAPPKETPHPRSSRYESRTSKNISLSNHTIAELQRLADEYDMNMTAIIELAVAHFSYSRKKGEWKWTQ